MSSSVADVPIDTQSIFNMQRLFSTPSQAYLELASEVFICGALSALLQRDEGEASEISRAASQKHHCEEDKNVTQCISAAQRIRVLNKL